MLKSKVALITGSTIGIGLGIAHSLAKQGADIVLNGFGAISEIEEFGSCQQRWPLFHAARFKLIDSLMCSFGGFSQTSLMGCQLRVDRLFQRLGMARLACSYT